MATGTPRDLLLIARRSSSPDAAHLTISASVLRTYISADLGFDDFEADSPPGPRSEIRETTNNNNAHRKVRGMDEVIRLKSRFVSSRPGDGSAGYTVGTVCTTEDSKSQPSVV